MDPQTRPLLRVHILADRCQGHGRCNAIAPEIFELDDLGNARATGEGLVPEDLAEKVRLAQANCPEFAIVIVAARAEGESR